ncbi:small ribosomal subunit protein mS37 [Gouania willdenowi]|uniref:CHCH domain-containing protein n=1 Tax=Gouania willdenowi TaxID=441366 RepID=A0A8C5GYI8_GOUWI|nr:coiled-coil-helix-coiled-coil-helix domain-containing protein 1 [Gouania willdenowi]
MAGQGGPAFLEKVARLLSRQEGKPVLKPNRRLVLKDWVANRRPKKGEATCITEMSVLMACWKHNSFIDAPCSSEIQSFYTCVHKAQAAMRTKGDDIMKGGHLSPKQATTLLKRFPNPRSEI